MKNIFLVCFLFCSVSLFGQGRHVYPISNTYPPETNIGPQSNIPGWINLAQWNTTSSNTMSVGLSSNFVDITSTSNGGFTSMVQYQPDFPTSLNHWKLVVTWKIKATGAGSSFFGIGIHSKNASDVNDYLLYQGTSSSGAGGLTFYNNGATGASLATDAGFTNHLNDIIQTTITFDDSVFTAKASNITQGTNSGTITYTLVQSTTSTTPRLPNSHTPAFWYFSDATGNVEIQNIQTSSTDTKNTNNLFLIDSKGGLYANSFAGRFWRTLGVTYATTTANGGPGDRTTDVLARRAEILGMNAQNVFLEVCSNSPRFGESLANTEADILTIKSWFDSTSTKFYFFIIPEDSLASVSPGIGLTALHNWAIATLGSSYISLVFTQMSASNRLKAIYQTPADGIHPNQAGHTVIDSILRVGNYLSVIDPTRYTHYVYNDPSIQVIGNKISLSSPTEKAAYYVNHWDANGNFVTGLIQDSIFKVNISANMTQIPATDNGATLLKVNGGITTVGPSGAFFFQDRTTNSNYFDIYSNANIFTWGYVGTDKMWMDNTGTLYIGLNPIGVSANGLYIRKNVTAAATFFGSKGFEFTADSTTYTMTSTGPNPDAGAIKFNAPTITSASATTVTQAETVEINGAPIATGSATITASYALYVTSGQTKLAIPTTSAATLNLTPSSAVNPTSPNDGDIWYNGTNLNFRHSGTTTDLLASGSTPTLQQVIAAGSTLTGNNTITNTNHVLIESGGIFNTTGGFYNSAQGSEILGSASTINNTVTAASGTVTNFSAYAFLAPTITSTNTGVSYTNPATLRIDNAPTMSTNSTGTGILLALDIAAGISHFGVGTSNFSIIADGSVFLNGGTATNTIGVGIGPSTTGQAALNLATGVDPTSGGIASGSGNAWYNGTNLYFVDGAGKKRDILNGIHNYLHTIFTPTTGGTVALVANQYNIINPSGSLLALTVNLPSSPNNNDVVYIKYTQAVTTVTYGNGTVVDGITSPISGGLVILTFDSGSSSWY